MSVARRAGRLASIIIVTLGVVYLGLVVLPAYSGGFDDPAVRGVYSVSPTKPVPLYGDRSSWTAPVAALAFVALLISVYVPFGLLPLAILVSTVALVIPPYSDHRGERLCCLLINVVVIAVMVITWRPVGNFASWIYG
jgi:hypothetical protein